MIGRAPRFWWQKPGWQSCLLAPVAAIYGAIAARPFYRDDLPSIALPVLCIGNYTLGGAGKTPTAIALARALKQRGLKPGIVSRGYGGNFTGTRLVDAERDQAAIVGDEPLLLARHAAVAISANRLEAARLLEEEGCDFILMDDGFQSRRLYADFSFLVVDGGRLIGNGKVFPSGPLRAPFDLQLQKTSAILHLAQPQKNDVGDAGSEGLNQFKNLVQKAGIRIFDAQLHPVSEAEIAGRKWLAFAGIGHPAKFFASVRQLGGIVVAEKSYADHYRFSQADMDELFHLAQEQDIALITTAKDHARMKDDLAASLLNKISIVDVEARIDDCADFAIHSTIEAFARRSGMK